MEDELVKTTWVQINAFEDQLTQERFILAAYGNNEAYEQERRVEAIRVCIEVLKKGLRS